VEAFGSGSAPSPPRWEPEVRAEANCARFISLLGMERSVRLSTATGGFGPNLPPRVLDVACGTGWSSIAKARAYPDSDQRLAGTPSGPACLIE
jgi:hypothetical protein